MSACVNIVCYKSKILSNGECPLMIRVAKNGKKKYKSLGISVKPEHWDFEKSKPKPKCPNKDIILKIILDKKIEYQKEILEMMSVQKEYTATSLITSKDNKITVKSVREFFEEIIKGHKKEGSIGYSNSFKHTLSSLKNFCKNTLDFPFSDIDISWLKRYEQWLRNNNNNEVTIFTTFRNIRTVYNKAIISKCVSKNNYPFNEYKLSKFNTKTKKRAISKEVIKKIIDVNLKEKDYYTQFSRDIFIFSYLCGGINFTDIAGLNKCSILGDNLVYIRKKTGKTITCPLSKEAMDIISKYSSEGEYLFPIYDENIHKTEIQKYHRLHKVLGKVNPSLKKIASMLDIKTNLTTYVARHSFATVLKNSGVNVALISETLGHSDISTTQIYLDSFEDKQLVEAFKNLL